MVIIFNYNEVLRIRFVTRKSQHERKTLGHPMSWSWTWSMPRRKSATSLSGKRKLILFKI